ncbi:hypothetical protein CDAR_208681 [Caerostris darwini]|uniref:Uncharacterized protein n=1 Tax=Caerostris darwini TaxID=1538125 RepID=A0AAV4VRT1_9ARAC|nr:hypothetical protein CDAR_208681 [Caerostris darwini]
MSGQHTKIVTWDYEESLDGDPNDVREVFVVLHRIQVNGTEILAARQIIGVDRIDCCVLSSPLPDAIHDICGFSSSDLRGA